MDHRDIAVNLKTNLAAIALALAAPSALAAGIAIKSTPMIPSYGQAVKLDLASDWPSYLPATRYTVVGNVITLEYEISTDGWSVGGPDFGMEPLNVGELPPGNYTVNARVYDRNQPGAAPQVATTNLPVLPPSDWGVYSIPQNPDAYQDVYAMVRSAVYYDPSTMRTTVAGNVIRVDFDYYGDAPISGPAPAGSTSYASVKVAGLAPGLYHLEGWGRAKAGGASEKYFTRDVAVATTSPVVEYFANTNRHYFITAGPGDIAGLDPGTLTWKRSGQRFKAWLRQQDAPANAVPVCRFYAGGPNSHFYTGVAADCQALKSLEALQRSETTAKGVAFLGWQYEQIAFYALLPVDGQCPGDTYPVYRAYNQRGVYNDSNHRFMGDPLMRSATLAGGWADEGPAFCSPF
jgi:hypothetical protein